MKNVLFVLLVLSVSFAFDIESYESYASVEENGDVYIYEKISFVLEDEYNEGYRSLRPADVESMDNLVVHNVKLNGKEIDFYTQVHGEKPEIVWTKTAVGYNHIEIGYTLKDRVEVFDDFARVCFEHFGADWDVPAQSFHSRMSLPEGSRGKEMHFEIYSSKKGEVYVDDLSIVVKMEDVPPGNYVGGCYLFDREAVDTNRTAPGFAYDILRSERESYGSERLLEPLTPPIYMCMPVFFVAALFAINAFLRRRKPENVETILPPDKMQPAIVAAIVKNEYHEKDIVAATILSLINRRFIDIIELEKKGERSLFAKRERTILILKKRKGLEPHEEAVMDMIFSNKKEVELDELVKEFRKISKQSEAEKHPVCRNMLEFGKLISAMLRRNGVWDLANRHARRVSTLGILAFLAFFLLVFVGSSIMPDLLYGIQYYESKEMWLHIALMPVMAVLSMAFVWYSAVQYMIPKPPKDHRVEFERWDAFARALKSSRIKEYPPSSVVIWGRILVYATAMGMADKVRAHLSELDDIVLVKKMEKMLKMERSSYRFYAAAARVQHISSPRVKSGGFSRTSSGGWSSGGGGGFSRGSSGGGGFR